MNCGGNFVISAWRQIFFGNSFALDSFAVILAAILMPQPKIANAATPADLGYSMPAEWEKHEATWLGWPHNASDWPGKI